MDQLCAASPDTLNNSINAEGLINVSPIVRNYSTSNDLVFASAPTVSSQSFADRSCSTT